MADTFIERLRADVEAEMGCCIAVGTGEASIQDVNEEYKTRRRTIRSSLKKLGLDDPNEWDDLWLWYGRWKGDGGLTTYQSRREFIWDTYRPLLEALDNLEERQLGTGIDVPATGWTDVDRQVAQLRENYARAETPEQFQNVGLLCRDIFISLGRAIFDPDKHLPPNKPVPKRDDAKNRLDYAVAAEYGGSDNEELGALVRSTYRFVQPRVHDQTEDRTDAMIAADATIHLVNVLTALFPSPTGWLQPELDEEPFEPGELYEPEPDFEPDSNDLRDHLEYYDEEPELTEP